MNGFNKAVDIQEALKLLDRCKSPEAVDLTKRFVGCATDDQKVALFREAFGSGHVFEWIVAAVTVSTYDAAREQGVAPADAVLGQGLQAIGGGLQAVADARGRADAGLEAVGAGLQALATVLTMPTEAIRGNDGKIVAVQRVRTLSETKT